MARTQQGKIIAVELRNYPVVVIYDIVCSRRRRRMVKCLNGFGMRVQKSAYECLLTRQQYEALVKASVPIIDMATDSLRMYLLYRQSVCDAWGIEIIQRKEPYLVI